MTTLSTLSTPTTVESKRANGENAPGSRWIFGADEETVGQLLFSRGGGGCLVGDAALLDVRRRSLVIGGLGGGFLSVALDFVISFWLPS